MNFSSLFAAVALLVTPSFAQSNADLEAKIDALAAELESLQLQDVMPAVGESKYGLGPAASKVYSKDQGLSIGGYGEARLRLDDNNDFDWYRHVMYFGYKFDENWVLNTEIELEHVTEVFVEFAYLDYLGFTENMNLRTGLMLNPMGLINEYHEPTTYLAANRSQTESVIIPSTWRENGVGVFGESNGFDYKLYYMNGLDGSAFEESSLRSGRQKGAEAMAEDFAMVASVNYVDIPGVRIGGSVYSGDSGQNQFDTLDDNDTETTGDDTIASIGSCSTDIVEFHVEYKSGPFWARAMHASAEVSDAFDDGVALDIDLTGTYYELGYNLMADSDASLYPFLRQEELDLSGSEKSITTYGIHYRPIDQIVFKLDVTDDDSKGYDTTSFVIGYVF